MEHSISPRFYPLVNKTAVVHLTGDDLIRPAEFGLMQSTLPFFQVLLNLAAFTVWFVIILYYWKIIYYQQSDPYATSLGSSPPNFTKRSEGSRIESLWEKVYQAFAVKR